MPNTAPVSQSIVSAARISCMARSGPATAACSTSNSTPIGPATHTTYFTCGASALREYPTPRSRRVSPQKTETRNALDDAGQHVRLAVRLAVRQAPLHEQHFHGHTGYLVDYRG